LPIMTEPEALRRGRRATTLAFLLLGIIWGAWAPHIALIAERLNLSPGVLGLVLLTAAAGSLVTMPIVGGIVARHGSGPVCRLIAPLVALALLLPALAPDLLLLILGALLLGALSGAMDVAMNAHGIAIEAKMRQPIVATLHAFYSLGALAGAGSAAALFPLAPYWTHILLVTAVALALSLPIARGMLSTTLDSGAGEQSFTWPPYAAWGIGFLAFVALVSEGAVQDWSALYLLRDLGTGAGTAALGVAAFSATMTIGRFTGDRLRARVADDKLLIVCALISSGGLAAGLLLTHPAIAIAGFALMGLGMANMVPLLFVAGARVPGLAPSVGLAAVTTVGYSGFVIGPAVIGGVAEFTGLRWSLFLMVIGILAVAVAAPRLLRA
jgi:MFS family permease